LNPCGRHAGNKSLAIQFDSIHRVQWLHRARDGYANAHFSIVFALAFRNLLAIAQR
jgi:hypothetical protein